MKIKRTKVNHRGGAILVMMALLLIVLFGAVAMAIDLGIKSAALSELQAAADSAALSGATLIKSDLGVDSQDASRQAARVFAGANQAIGASISLDPSADIEFGFWDRINRELLPPRTQEVIQINAIRVRLHRDDTNAGGPIPYFFAGLLGHPTGDAAAVAIAYLPDPSPTGIGQGTRFLIDDEMFDTDEPAIEELARKLRVDPDELLWHSVPEENPSNSMTNGSENPDDWDWSKWFIKIPPNTILELPTGQVGDEGLLDLAANVGRPDLPQYPFADPVRHQEFLKYDESSDDGTVRKYQDRLFRDKDLDPLAGVGRFNEPFRYLDLIDPNFVHVSPVFKSDVSALDGVSNADENNGPDIDGDGNPDGLTTNERVAEGVNAKGERRGLVAFKILDVVIDPDRPYPYLPNLVIEIVDPATIDIGGVQPVGDSEDGSNEIFSSGGAPNVRLVL